MNLNYHSKLHTKWVFLLLIGTKIFAQSGLNVHGYLSQAFAISDKYQIFGIPTDGTADYRALALQFRYDIDEYNSSIIQFSHRRIGNSPLMELEKDVVLDWAFFEHRFNDNLGFKIGKILIPFGYYNEIRDVGVLLPFYRPPYTPYTMGAYLSETVNGMDFFYIKNFDDWDLNLDVYGGSWEWRLWFNQRSIISDGIITLIDISTVRNATGARLSCSLHDFGIAGGLSWQRGDVSGKYFFGTEYGGVRPQTFNMFNLYFDYSNDLFYTRPEITKMFFEPGDFYIDGISFTSGVNVYSGISANFSFEMLSIYDVPNFESETSNLVTDRDDSKYLKDFAIGLNYRFNSHVILKSELHFNKSLATEDIYKNVFSDDPEDMKYFILSLATSF